MSDYLLCPSNHTLPTKKLQSDYVVLHHQWERSLIPRPPELETRLEYIQTELGEAICRSIVATLPMAVASSTIPRPLPPPVFDHLQYANTDGGGWEIFPILVTSGRQRVGWCPTITIPISRRPIPGIMNNGTDTALRKLRVSALGQTLTREGFRILCQALTQVCLPDSTVYISQTFPLHICKWSN